MKQLATKKYRGFLCALFMAVIATVGCASNSEKWVALRSQPYNPLAGPLSLMSRSGPKSSPRTEQLLRQYDLIDQIDGDRRALITRLEAIQHREPSLEIDYAQAEVAYTGAVRAERSGKQGEALELYGTTILHAYRYLFSEELGFVRNPYDPQFRGACDLYNQALEGTLRMLVASGELKPGQRTSIKTANHDCQFSIELHSTGWHEEDVDRFEFVSDYQVNGLRNHYSSYGLGVPLIAVRRHHENESAAERFYPPNLSYPLTAFLRVIPPNNTGDKSKGNQAAPTFVLELHDPLDKQTVEVAHHQVPLEADLSTPLAFFLNQPEFDDSKLSTAGLLHPERVEQLRGLYMMEPYDPNKMPVLMVHGLWSSPVTWMEMYNDLRSDPEVRKHYQFWFYLYPSGQPFWLGAAQMREDLAAMRKAVDPNRERPALDQMVLVGHSMGGLISKMQAIDSGDEFWKTVSEKPFSELDAEDKIRKGLARTFYFQPNSSVRRVVTIGTPHRGSEFSNDLTRWLGRKLISMPSKISWGRQQLLAKNRGYFRKSGPFNISTSIDSLAPDSPIFPALLAAEPGPWISFHNVIGRAPREGIRGYFGNDGDGVVAVKSAQLSKMKQLRSEIIVASDHSAIHRHPQTVLEVRRILFEQLAELRGVSQPTQRAMVATATSAVEKDKPATAPVQR